MPYTTYHGYLYMIGFLMLTLFVNHGYSRSCVTRDCEVCLKSFAECDQDQTGYIRIRGQFEFTFSGDDVGSGEVEDCIGNTTPGCIIHLARVTRGCAMARQRSFDSSAPNFRRRLRRYLNNFPNNFWLAGATQDGTCSSTLPANILNLFLNFGIDYSVFPDEGSAIFLGLKGSMVGYSMYNENGDGPTANCWTVGMPICRFRMPQNLPSDAAKRDDNNKLALVLNKQACASGEVVGWQFYALSTGILTLSTWRLSANGEDVFENVGRTIVLVRSKGMQYRCLSSRQRIKVEESDIPGIYYPRSRSSPIVPFVKAGGGYPYDCEDTVYYNDDTNLVFSEYYLGRAQTTDQMGQSETVEGAYMFAPIMDTNFRYQCSCRTDSDCTDGGDTNMRCISRTCQCRAGTADFVYDPEAGVCVYDKQIPVVSGTPTHNSDAGTNMDEVVDDKTTTCVAQSVTASKPWLVVELCSLSTIYSVTVTVPQSSNEQSGTFSATANTETTITFADQKSTPCLEIADSAAVVTSVTPTGFSVNPTTDLSNVGYTIKSADLHDFNVYLSEQGPTDTATSNFDLGDTTANWIQCGSFKGSAKPGSASRVPCDCPTKARFVAIQINNTGVVSNDNNILNICEVSAKGNPDTLIGVACDATNPDNVCTADARLTCVNGVCDCVAGYTCQPCNPTEPIVDVNECLQDDTCDPNGSCLNTEGSFECSCPVSGYELDADGKTCKLTNECDRFPSPCTNAVCSELDPDPLFKCTCYGSNSGSGTYKPAGDSETVCTLPQPNGCKSVKCEYDCVNIGGIAACICPEGEELNEDGLTCKVVDMCKRPNTCPHGCENNKCTCTADKNSYYDPVTNTCPCKVGYFLNGNTEKCEVSLACLNGDLLGCQCEQLCFDNKGNAYCGCLTGYYLSNDACNCLGPWCVRMAWCGRVPYLKFNANGKELHQKDMNAEQRKRQRERRKKSGNYACQSMYKTTVRGMKKTRGCEVVRTFPCSLGMELVADFDHPLTQEEESIVSFQFSQDFTTRNDTFAIDNETSMGSADLIQKPYVIYPGDDPSSYNTTKLGADHLCHLFNQLALCNANQECIEMDGIPFCACKSGWSGDACDTPVSTSINNLIIIIVSLFAVGVVVTITLIAIVLIRRRDRKTDNTADSSSTLPDTDSAESTADRGTWRTHSTNNFYALRWSAKPYGQGGYSGMGGLSHRSGSYNYQ